MSVKMTRYKQADFVDEDSSSIGTIQLNETTLTSPTALHIRYHTARGTSMWRARTTLEKCLIITTIFLVFIILIVFINMLDDESDSSSAALRILHVQPHNQLPCLNEQCIHASSDILQSVDIKVNPCDDFYGYACNQWIKNNPIPDGKSTWGTFGKLEQQNQLVIKNVLEQPLAAFRSDAERKAKLYYLSCLDEDEIIEKLGAQPMQRLLREIGGWNITESDFVLVNWTLAQSLSRLQNRYNMGGLFSWAVGEDDRNSTRHIIQIDQGGLTLPTREHYLNRTAHEKVLNAYLEYMTKVAVLLGGEEEDSRLQMSKIIEFETRIAGITIPNEDRRDEEALYHLKRLSDLQIEAPFLNWTEHFGDALIQVNRTISETDFVVVYAPEFLSNLTTLIEEYTATDDGKIILNNYLVWQTVRTLTTCLSKTFRDAYKGVRKALIGSDGGEEPWRYCVTDTSNVIGFAVGAMFVREVFHGDAKPQAEQMINEIRAAFKHNLKNLQWMDGETRRLAEEKADAISDMIGFPNCILLPAELDEKYAELAINETEYFENNIRVNVYNLRKNLEKIDQPVNKTRWGMTPPTVNAYYTPTKNQIVFPAGILQLPFYDIKNPKSLNFGAMGVVMGHELTHAFDDEGRQYDKNGNLHQWWNNRTIAKFKNRTDCFANQYSLYDVDGQHLNGKQTLGENIADNGGLKAAFHAFLTSKEEKEADRLPLPGLNLTHRQLFFISFAQVWCSSFTTEASTLQIEKDAHSPPKFRVIGPLSNLKEFSEEFQCPVGAPMNPLKKCEVW